MKQKQATFTCLLSDQYYIYFQFRTFSRSNLAHSPNLDMLSHVCPQLSMTFLCLFLLHIHMSNPYGILLLHFFTFLFVNIIFLSLILTHNLLSLVSKTSSCLLATACFFTFFFVAFLQLKSKQIFFQKYAACLKLNL